MSRLSARWAPWGALLRRARRLAWRSPLRTAWTGLLVLVAVAVAAVVLSAVWGENSTSTSYDRALGTADVIYRGTAPADVAPILADELLAQLPPHSRVAVEESVVGLVLTARGAGGTSDPDDVGGVYGGMRMADWDDPLLRGVLDFLEGHAPGAGEVAVSPEVAGALQLAVGDRLEIDSPDNSLVVSGIATIGNGGLPEVAVASGELVPSRSAAPRPEVGLTAHVGLAGKVAPSAGSLDLSAPQLGGLVMSGPFGRPGDSVGVEGSALFDQPSSRLETITVMLALAVAVVGLLAGASSALGARRRLRASGLLAASGADQGQLAIAVAAEVGVVASPAAVLGLLASWFGVRAWVGLRLQGWPLVATADFDWVWISVLLVGAVGAACGGAVLSSRGTRSLPASVMLDSRARPAAPVVGGRAFGWAGWIVLGLVAWAAASYFIGWVSGPGGFVGPLSVLVLLALWFACASVALRFTTAILGRDPIGRIVDRDIRRRRVGSAATVLIVATWVFIVVIGTATAAFGSTYQNDEAQSSAQSFPAEQPSSEPSSTAVATTAGPSPDVAEPAATPASGTGTSILIQNDRTGGTGRSAGGVWQLRDSEPLSEPEHAAEPLPASLAADVARAGLVTSSATVGEWTGDCGICPDGFMPSVLVLDGTEGAGLSPGTAELLNGGNAVTPFDMEGIEDETVAGLPVRAGSVPAGVQAVVLSSSIAGSIELAETRPALIGSSVGLTDDQAREVLRIADDHGASVGFDDPRMDMLRSDSWEGYVVLDRRPWIIWPSIVVLLLAALAATAAHRREHGDAARVLRVLGARPRSARRLVSLTAGALTGTGVVLGLSAALLVVGVEVVVDGADSVSSRRDALVVVALSIALPFVVALLARLIPPYRSLDGPDGPMPA